MLIQYQNGFGNHFSSEALADALPKAQNSPQKPPYGLYAEQLSGNAFTAPRATNVRSWLYRIRPSVLHGHFKEKSQPHLKSTPFHEILTPPTQLRWFPLPFPEKPTDFIDGLYTLAGHGSTEMRQGAAVHLYAASQSMQNRYFYNADGDFLIVPQEGMLRLRTEFGILEVEPSEIAVIQRGIKFTVEINGPARGYVCENYGSHFVLPELGLIGSNGLANSRDFQAPVACYEEKTGDFELVTKFQGHLWSAPLNHSPLDVVAWHGNYVPYKYDLKKFNTMNTVSFDHPDPSIFTVLTSPSSLHGVANLDFVIFPPRWMVAEHTFRPPYYHRNIMSEFMGLIQGAYDAKGTDFMPGGGSLHNCMSAHGPDADAFNKATQSKLKPVYCHNTLAFMFESHFPWLPTKFGLESEIRDKDYLACWAGLEPAKLDWGL